MHDTAHCKPNGFSHAHFYCNRGNFFVAMLSVGAVQCSR